MGAYGPFLPNLEPAERACRFRSLATLAAVLIPPSAYRSALVDALRQAEQDDAAVATAHELFEGLATLARRRILSVYAEVHRPQHGWRGRSGKKIAPSLGGA